MIRGQAAESGQRLGCLLVLVLLDQEAWGLRQEDQAHDQYDGPRELNGDWDAVGSGILTVLDGVVDNGSQEKTLSTVRSSVCQSLL